MKNNRRLPSLLAALALAAGALAPAVKAQAPAGTADEKAAQVADRLFLSPYTVKAHLRSVYNKTGASSRTAASRLARAHGLA